MVKTPMKAGNLYTTVHGLGCVSDATFRGNPQPPRTLEFLETSEGLGPSKMVVSSWKAGHLERILEMRWTFSDLKQI